MHLCPPVCPQGEGILAMIHLKIEGGDVLQNMQQGPKQPDYKVVPMSPLGVELT